MQWKHIAEPIKENAETFPQRIALIHGDGQLTYGQLWDAIQAWASVLRDEYEIGEGDHVAYILPNGLDIAELYYAVQVLGAVAVPLNERLIAEEIVTLLRLSDAKLLVYAPNVAEKIETLPWQAEGAISGDRAMVQTVSSQEIRFLAQKRAGERVPLVGGGGAWSRIQFTGGTTGIPKGACRSHCADLFEADSLRQMIGLGERECETVLVQSPVSHHGGHGWLITSLSAGATLILCGKFDAHELLTQMEHYRVTHLLIMPPTIYSRLFEGVGETDYDLSSVRFVQTSAGLTTASINELILDRFPNAVLSYGWGQSESGAGTAVRFDRQMIRDASPVLTSIGRPMAHVEMRLVDDDGNDVAEGDIGEAILRGATVMDGYYHLDELQSSVFTEDGWLRTGDMMRRDKEGYYYLVSRKKDMIKSGGENVFVGEVEQCLLAHPAITDCIVFGTEDAEYDEAVAAVVTVKPGAEVTLAEVQEHCKAHLASYKKPRYLMVVEAFDRDDAGKIRKQTIIDEFERQKAALQK